MTAPRGPFEVSHVVFDVDGTLVDYVGAGRQALISTSAAIVERTGTEVAPQDLQAGFMRLFRDPEWRPRGQTAIRVESLRRVLARLDVTDIEVAEELATTYATTRDEALKPYSDVITTLETLREAGFELRAASNGNMDLAALGLDGYFASIELAPQLGVSKPDPRFFAAVAERAGVEPASMLVVGDRVDNDYEPARAAGMHALVIDRRGRVEDPSVARIEVLTEVIDLVRRPGAADR